MILKISLINGDMSIGNILQLIDMGPFQEYDDITSFHVNRGNAYIKTRLEKTFDYICLYVYFGSETVESSTNGIIIL